MSSKTLNAVIAIAVALWGVGLTVAYYLWGIAPPIAATVILIIIGLGLERYGLSLLPRRPAAAIRILPWWGLFPAAIAGVASVAVFVANAKLGAIDIPGLESKADAELGKSLATAISAFLGALILKSA